jgi:hypothetical protein
MTEEEWLRSQDPDPMWRLLEVVDPSPSLLRKSRLLACAFARLIWEIHDEQGKQIIESMERYADGDESLEDFRVVMGDYYDRVEDEPDPRRQAAGNCVLGLSTARHENYPLRFAVTQGRLALSARQQSDEVWKSNHVPEICITIRDIFGNPFRPVVLESSLRTESVVSLARAMYESRNFSDIKVVAETLQNAGCDNQELLDHCRGSVSHIRGCWVVDLLLGKA